MIGTITRTVLALVVVAAIRPVGAAEPIRLGAHAPQTGALATHGIEQIKGIRLGAEQFEKAHGVKVQLFVYDDESAPQKAVAAVEKLAGIEKVHAIVGGYGSNLVGPASEVSERYDVPYMTTGAVDTKLTQKKFKNFFRLNYMPGYASAQSGAMKDLFGARKVAVLYNSQSATTEIAEVVRDQLKAKGVDVPVFEKFEKGTTNYKPLLLKAKDAGCDALLVEGYFPDYVGTIKDAKILNLPVKAYMGAWGIGTPEFIRDLGPMSELVYGTSIWEKGTAPPASKGDEDRMVAAYRAKYNEEPSYIAMLGYLSAQFMLDAVVKGAAGGPYDPAKTRQALRALDTESVLGRVAFDEKGDPKYFSAVLFQTVNGKQVVVYPRERSQGKPIYPGVPWSPPAGK